MANTSALKTERQPYNAFEHLWRSLFLKEQSLMAMFTIYLDESHGSEDAFSVAGYVATVEQWEEFEREWKELLKEEEIPFIHKANLEWFWGKEYKQWRDLPDEEKRQKRDRINNKAVDIILRRVSAGFSASVKKSDWLAVDKGKWGKWMGEGHYAAVVKLCMILVTGWADKFNRNEPINWVFERDAVGKEEVGRMLSEIALNEHDRELFRLGTVSFASKKRIEKKGVIYPAVIPLQAADFIAYETYREMGNRIVGGVKRERRMALERLLQHDLQRKGGRYEGMKNDQMPTPHYMFYHQKEDVESMVQQLNERYPDLEI